VTKRGQGEVLDFGLAKIVMEPKAAAAVTVMTAAAFLTSPGIAVGTVCYMSPEQARGKELDARSDVFSLGAVLYQMTTGRIPFDGQTSAVIFDAILNHDPVSPTQFNPEVPTKLERSFAPRSRRTATWRYQSAAELRADLKRLKRRHTSGAAACASASTSAAGSSRNVSALRRRSCDRACFGETWSPESLDWCGYCRAAGCAGIRTYRVLTRPRGFNLQNMQITKLTDNGKAGAVAISPDGQYVVYVLRDGEKAEPARAECRYP